MERVKLIRQLTAQYMFIILLKLYIMMEQLEREKKLVELIKQKSTISNKRSTQEITCYPSDFKN